VSGFPRFSDPRRCFALRREFRHLGAAGDYRNPSNPIGQEPFVSSSLNSLVVPKRGVVDFEKIMAIPDQGRRERAFRKGVMKLLKPIGISRKTHLPPNPGIINDGPVLWVSGIVDLLITGKSDVHAHDLLRLVPSLRDEEEAIAYDTFGQTPSKRTLLVEPFRSNENVDVEQFRSTLNVIDRKKPNWNDPEKAVNIEAAEDLVVYAVIEYTRKITAHAMAMGACLEANPNFDPSDPAQATLFKDKLDAIYKKLYKPDARSPPTFKVPGYGATTADRYIELLAADVLINPSVTASKFPTHATHNLLCALHQNLAVDREWIIGTALTAGAPGNMITAQIAFQRT
jgi:hypothetical protein